ncbi:MAG TPA: DUF1553 domain-containing protein, partial [Gemmatales bacterium]|nr:DUF1553 domain-containing protein [Gemmatales bacterium]
TREQCTVARARTNTPLQALVTLNDIQFVEAARHLATLTLNSKSTSDDRLEYLAERLLARSWKPEEKKIILASLADLTSFYEKNEAEAKKLITVGDSKPDTRLNVKELAAWTMLCNQLLNLDEVLNK